VHITDPTNMTAYGARRAAAALALRWHAGTGALVAMTAALTLAGAVPALALLGGGPSAPHLQLDLAATAGLRADWGGSGVAWPQLQQLALMQLTTMLRGGAILTLLIGSATLVALHLARTAARSGEVIVSRAVGASRRAVLGAALLEAGALAVVALSIGAVISLGVLTALKLAWPGRIDGINLALSAAGVCAIGALIMAGPLLLVRALTTRRLVDDDRRPLTLVIPAMQLGAALVVLAGGMTLRRATASQLALGNGGAGNSLVVQRLHATEPDRLKRAQRFAAFLAAQHARAPERLISVGSFGVHRGFGTSAQLTTDCVAVCAVGGMPVRNRTETALHHVVSGDTFAVAGIRLLAGRTFTANDNWDAPLVAVVSARMARELFGDGQAVGKRVNISLLDNRWFEVVGVVADVRADGLGASLLPPYAVYVSVLQHPVTELELATTDGVFAADALTTIGAALGVPAPISAQRTTDRRVLAWFTEILLWMAGIAICVAVGGLVVMLRLWLDSQLLELGVRRAAGARRSSIHRLVLGRASSVSVCGSLFGAWLGLIAWDVLPRVLPGAPAYDAPLVAITAIALFAITLASAWWIASRFTRVPVHAMLLDGAG
jgi:MacB-like periplasmic core domain